MRNLVVVLLIVLTNLSSCKSQSNPVIAPGGYSMGEYLPLIMGKKVGLLVNHSSLVGNVHLLDTLISLDVNISKVFAPEHGFRGVNDAGEHVSNEVDAKTGIPIVSLYGRNKKPTLNQLDGIDVVLFDLQDVGVRFYTYISTMHYMMEACAEAGVSFVVLDRPNPNGDYYAGPVLNPEFSSFVGMHPIPVVHGLTVGELAGMINGEGWLKGGLKCDLRVIKAKNWDHNIPYELPVKPSPNLPNHLSVRLYPSLCFFEATNVSIGRGTFFPFQVIGYPNPTLGNFSFTPKSIEGMSKSPKQQNVTCYGIDLRDTGNIPNFTFSYFVDMYEKLGKEPGFELNERWFNLLAGNDIILKEIKQGVSLTEVALLWQEDLDHYGKLRDKYLLYSKEDGSELPSVDTNE